MDSPVVEGLITQKLPVGAYRYTFTLFIGVATNKQMSQVTVKYVHPQIHRKGPYTLTSFLVPVAGRRIEHALY